MRSILLFLLLVPSPLFAADSNEITNANVLALMNEYRAEQGLPALREDERLTRAAQDRVKHMEDFGYWAHEAPDGTSPFVWMVARDYSYSAAAENLASGFETVRLLVQSWMESAGHRENILGTDFEDCGIAIIDGATTGPATGKSIVVLFGAKRQPLVAVTRP
jgi:uncharacterized protein YkwD